MTAMTRDLAIPMDVPMPEFLRVLYSSVFQVLALFWSASILGKVLLFPIPAITRDDGDSGDLLRFSRWIKRSSGCCSPCWAQ